MSPHLTFCEPDVVRFREDLLKLELGPLASMLKTDNLTQTDFDGILGEQRQVRLQQQRQLENKTETLDTHYRTKAWQQPLDSHIKKRNKKKIRVSPSLTVSVHLSPLCRLQPTDKTGIPARDINHSMTHLTHRPFSSAGHPIIRLNAAGSYEASESNG